MPTIADYLNDLNKQRNNLADNLNEQGVNASRNELLNTLVPKVLKISGAEDLTEELNNYNQELTEQEQTLDDIVLALKNKAGLQPEVVPIISNGSYLFQNNLRIEDIEKNILAYLDPNMQDASYMFNNATNLVTLPKFNTKNITNAYYMFYGCTSLKNLPNEIDFSSATILEYLFYDCSSLTKIPKLKLKERCINASCIYRLYSIE